MKITPRLIMLAPATATNAPGCTHGRADPTTSGDDLTIRVGLQADCDGLAW